MDPNATLAEIRALNASALAGEIDAIDACERFIELFEALDKWLLSDGFLPSDWAKNEADNA